MSGGTKDTQVTKSNNRRVVVMMAACSVFIFLIQSFVFLCFFLPARPQNWDGRHLSLFPPSLKCRVTE